MNKRIKEIEVMIDKYRRNSASTIGNLATAIYHSEQERLKPILDVYKKAKEKQDKGETGKFFMEFAWEYDAMLTDMWQAIQKVIGEE